MEANSKVVNYLDVTLDLRDGSFRPYLKPGNVISYVSTLSNHPPSILKSIPEGINKRLNTISSSEEIFVSAIPPYQEALTRSGYSYKLHWIPRKYDSSPPLKKSRTRNVTWFNPPYDKTMETDIGKEFLGLVDNHFPEGSALHKIINRNTVKISYMTMPNFAKI